MGEPWPQAVQDYVRRRRQEGDVADPELCGEVREKLGVVLSTSALRQYCSNRGWLKARGVTPWPLQRAVGPPPRINPKGGLFCFSDAHAPCHDADWINKGLELAHAWGIEVALSIGDLANMDALTRWERQDEGYEDEQKGTRRLVDAILELLELHAVLGNHCIRLARELGWKVSARKAVLDYLGKDKDDERLHVYQHRCAVAYGSWRLEHAKRTSMIACGPAHNMCAQHQMNAVTAHSHVWGAVQDITGTRIAIDIGHCANIRKLNYLQQQTFSRTQPCQGLLILQPDSEGRVIPWHLHPKFTDFGALLELGPYFRKVNAKLRNGEKG